MSEIGLRSEEEIDASFVGLAIVVTVRADGVPKYPACIGAPAYRLAAKAAANHEANFVNMFDSQIAPCEGLRVTTHPRTSIPDAALQKDRRDYLGRSRRENILRRHRRLIARKKAIDDSAATRRGRPRRMVEIELLVGPVADEHAWIGGRSVSGGTIILVEFSCTTSARSDGSFDR